MAKKISTYGLLIALAFLFGFLESIFPLPVPVPGIKLGLANIVIMTALYLMSARDAFILMIIRILLAGFTFGGMASALYSLGGGLLSFCVMAVLKKTGLFSMLGVSIAGGVFHNVGQLLVAIVVLKSRSLMGYFPVLLVSGVVTGLVVGILSNEIYKRLKIYNVTEREENENDIEKSKG
ncbi:Gx transporter family protein [Anaerolentibacter hominis]|uniref:Gx transporter family protein n=1 Tax=Anaerolentibacter hominis TaxID=3079009 RepID=UPI0031B831F6